MITIYICSRCECPSLTVYGDFKSPLCIKCKDAIGRFPRNTDSNFGSSMGDKMIRVIFPGGRQLEMALTENSADITAPEAEIVVKVNNQPIKTGILVGARRKIRV